MGRMIFIISLLSRLNFIFIFLFWVLVTSLVILAIEELMELEFNGDLKNSKLSKCIKKLLIATVITGLPVIAIPEKEEMYLIALTKDYQAEDIYKMSKNEVKSAIDYAFERFEKIKE